MDLWFSFYVKQKYNSINVSTVKKLIFIPLKNWDSFVLSNVWSWSLSAQQGFGFSVTVFMFVLDGSFCWPILCLLSLLGFKDRLPKCSTFDLKWLMLKVFNDIDINIWLYRSTCVDRLGCVGFLITSVIILLLVHAGDTSI